MRTAIYLGLMLLASSLETRDIKENTATFYANFTFVFLAMDIIEIVVGLL